MDSARKRARRIQKVLGSVERARRAQLLQIENKGRECAAEQEAILRSFTNSDQFAVQFAELISRRVSALFNEGQKIEAECVRRRRHYCDAAMREREARSLLERATLSENMTLEDKDRIEVIELTLAQALGKSSSSD